MDILLFRAALSLYLASCLGYLASLFARRVLVAKYAGWGLLAALVVHTLAFGARCLATHQSPLVDVYAALSFFAWVLAAVYLVFQVRTKTRVLGVLVAPAVVILMMAASAGLGGAVALPPILRGHLVSVHIVLAVIGEACLALVGLAGAMYLLQDRLIRGKRTTRLLRLLPPLEDLDRINHLGLLWGFPLLTLGVIAGALWARTVWGTHWPGDPKLVWTLLAWALYGLLLHQRLALGWKGRRMAIGALTAIGFLLAALAATGLFFQSVHTFG